MADSQAAASAGVIRPAPPPPPRPSLVLPPRSSYDVLPGGAAWNSSPGPMTLVSSFFEHDTHHRSFSQLLAGAIASPPVTSAAAEVPCSPVFTVPPGLSPGGLLNSPALFGRFGMSHQEALAQVTAQARSSVNFGEGFASFASKPVSFMAQSTDSASNIEPSKEMPPPKSNERDASCNKADRSHLDKKSLHTAISVGKPAEDGYKWRKYGQKQVKGSEYTRSYYKCTHPNCSVKKKSERNDAAEIMEIIYKGQHNHQLPSNNRRGKQGSSSESKSDTPVTTEECSNCLPKVTNRLNEFSSACTSKEDEVDGASEQLSCSIEGGEDTDLRTDEIDVHEPEAKRSTLTEPRIVVQTTSEVDLLNDGYKWRKYGQKVVKGNPNPRSYYKCTSMGCNVRKHIERAATDPKFVLTTYEGKHNHEIPSGRKNSHNIANVSNRNFTSMDLTKQNSMSSGQFFLDEQQLRRANSQAFKISRLKEES